MEIEVKTNDLRRCAGRERDVANALRRVDGELLDCKRRLNGCMSSSSSPTIQRALDKVHTVLNVAIIKDISRISDTLEIIVAEYERTESELSGNKPSEDELEEAGGGALVTDGNYKPTWNNIFDMFKELFDKFGDILDNKILSAIAGIFGFNSSICRLANSSDIAEWVKNYFGLSNSVIGMSDKSIEALKDMIGKYGTSEAKKWLKKNGEELKDIKDILGDTGKCITLFEDAASAYIDGNGNISDVLRNYVKNGSDISELAEIFGLKGGDGAATAALTGIVGNLFADTIELWNDGHAVTGQEMAEWCLNGALGGISSGMNALIGVVDEALGTNINDYVFLDMDRAINIYNYNSSWATDQIVDMTSNTAAQIGLTVVAVPVVALWSTAEVFVDIGYQTGNKIKEMLGLGHEWNLIDALQGKC